MILVIEKRVSACKHREKADNVLVSFWRGRKFPTPPAGLLLGGSDLLV